jgi:hypothetical protein
VPHIRIVLADDHTIIRSCLRLLLEQQPRFQSGRAFLSDRYSMTDLNALVPEDSPLYLVFATWINDVGEIVGWGVGKNTEEIRAFVARPAKPAAGKSLKPAFARRTLPVSVRNRLQQHVLAVKAWRIPPAVIAC